MISTNRIFESAHGPEIPNFLEIVAGLYSIGLPRRLYVFKFMIQDGGHLRVSALQERQKFRHIDVNTRLMKLSKYWNRRHKSLYRFMNIFEAKSMINRDENGGLIIKFTKR